MSVAVGDSVRPTGADGRGAADTADAEVAGGGTAVTADPRAAGDPAGDGRDAEGLGALDIGVSSVTAGGAGAGSGTAVTAGGVTVREALLPGLELTKAAGTAGADGAGGGTAVTTGGNRSVSGITDLASCGLERTRLRRRDEVAVATGAARSTVAARAARAAGGDAVGDVAAEGGRGEAGAA